MAWFDSFLYLFLISILAFPLGRLIPREWIHYDRFPFRAFEWENGGCIYHRLEIRSWQNKLPDMSRFGLLNMKVKKLNANFTAEDVRLLLDETCIAEIVHTLLCFAGLHCINLWKGTGGIVFYILYITICQLPYIFIQRYNRPRLSRVFKRMTKERSTVYESADSELQYGRRS